MFPPLFISFFINTVVVMILFEPNFMLSLKGVIIGNGILVIFEHISYHYKRKKARKQKNKRKKTKQFDLTNYDQNEMSKFFNSDAKS